ncbi:MAG TPA: VOC family protein [Mycobacterium sp.]|nr:VOC family protein [Mycobacterium sp.]
MIQRVDPPAGYHSVTPRMIVSDVADEVEFLRACFDASGEIVAGRPTEVRIGDSLIMVSDTSERDAFPALLYVYVTDADETYQRGIAAGAATVEEPRDVPWGDRRAIIADKHGNVFQIAHRRS